MLTDDQIRGKFPRFDGNLDHLRKLLEGVEAWNAWRANTPDESPDLKNLDLGERDAQSIKGELGPLWKKHKDSGSRWVANLKEVRLDGADLDGAHLEGASLYWAHLEGVNLNGAHLEGANLIEAHLVGAKLQGAFLERADLYGAHLERADLGGAHLERANLYRAFLKGSLWDQADLSGADLRVSKPQYLRLDDTRILHSRFAPGSRDPWSVVRRSYSGPSLLFHLLFLLLFLAPYLGRAAYWKGVNAAQGAASTFQQAVNRQVAGSVEVLEGLAKAPTVREELAARWEASGIDAESSRELFEEAGRRLRDRATATAKLRALRPVQKIGLCLQPLGDCSPPQPIWRLLLGLHQHDSHFLLRILALVLILYNVSRGILTYYISGLRDAEIRGGYSPRLKEYLRAYRLHAYFLKWVPVAGLTVAGFQIAEWLLVTDVVLPAF